MPIYLLQVKIEFENIKELIPILNNHWKINISNGEDSLSREGITVSKEDVYELDGSKGTANFTLKWDKKDPNVSTINILDFNSKQCVPSISKNNEWQTILAMDCRGIQPTHYLPSIDFNVITNSGKVFEDVDLTDKEWTEYDDENDEPITIMNIEGRFIKA